MAQKGAVGLFTNLWFDETNAANIVYYSRKADGVFRVWGTPPAWNAEQLRAGGGTNTVAAPSSDGSRAVYAWFDPAKNKVMTGDIL